MNIETLRVFCDVVLHQSFSRGASANEVSQSAATQSIHRLEKQLATPLIDRGKRPFVLTPEGQICYEAFREILERYDNVVAQIRSPQENLRGQLRVGAIYSVGLHKMSLCMKEFLRTFPKTRIRLEYMHPHQIYQAVLNSEIDLGVISYPTASQEIDVIPLVSEDMVFVCPPGHPKAGRSEIVPSDLNDCDFIAFDRNLIIRKEVDRYLRQHGVGMNIAMEFDNIETIKQAIETGLGVGVLPAPTVLDEVRLGVLAAVPLAAPAPTRPIGIIYRHRKIFSTAATKFIEMLTRESQNV